MGTDLGSNWDEVVGDSQIVGGELQIPAGGICISVPHADRGAQKVYVTMIDLQPDKIYRIIINYSYGDGSYHYVEYECTSTPSGSDYVSYLRVGDSTGGDSNEIADTYTAGQDMPLEACRTPGGLYGLAEHSEIVAWACSDEPNALYAGLMNNSDTDDIEFDDFGIIRYEGTNSGLFPGDPDTVHRCYTCACECDGYCLPDTLTLTIINTGGLATCLEGETVTLTYLPGTDPFEWHGSASLKTPDCPAFGSTVNFIFYCDGDSSFSLETDWGLAVQTGWGGCTHLGWVNCFRVDGTPYYLSCNPLDIIFGQFVETVSGNDGTYYIEITE